jgi:hypothetical protein
MASLRLAAAMSPEVVDAFAEQAIEENSVDFAQRTSGPEPHGSTWRLARTCGTGLSEG